MTRLHPTCSGLDELSKAGPRPDMSVPESYLLPSPHPASPQNSQEGPLALHPPKGSTPSLCWKASFTRNHPASELAGVCVCVYTTSTSTAAGRPPQPTQVSVVRPAQGAAGVLQPHAPACGDTREGLGKRKPPGRTSEASAVTFQWLC